MKNIPLLILVPFFFSACAHYANGTMVAVTKGDYRGKQGRISAKCLFNDCYHVELFGHMRNGRTWEIIGEGDLKRVD